MMAIVATKIYFLGVPYIGKLFWFTNISRAFYYNLFAHTSQKGLPFQSLTQLM